MPGSAGDFRKQVLSRLERLEKAVFGGRGTGGPTRSVERKSGGALPDRIVKLRDQGFFNPPKTAAETHKRLQPGYPCELDRVAMALLRLQRHHDLRKASKIVDGKKRAAYVW